MVLASDLPLFVSALAFLSGSWLLDLTYTLRKNRYLTHESMPWARTLVRKFGKKGLLLNLPVYAAIAGYHYFLFRDVQLVSYSIFAMGAVVLILGFGASVVAMSRRGKTVNF